MAARLEVVADERAAARRAAELIAETGSAATAERGPFGFAMSGGRSPWAMLAILGELEQMPWGETELFQVDERIASPGSEDRNLTHMVLGLSMEHQPALRPMPVTQRDLEAAAREYESSLPERLDLVHLGLGPDGHTPSLVPGDPVLEGSDRRVALTAGEYQGYRRMTLTYPALNAARQILWLVTGAEKREPLVNSERAGEILVQVLELAEALPFRPRAEIQYPRLADRLAGKAAQA